MSRHRARLGALLLALGLGTPLHAQAAPAGAVGTPVPSVQVRWPLVDLAVVADSMRGMAILASPSMHAKRSRPGLGLAWLANLRPEAAAVWADTVAALFRAARRTDSAGADTASAYTAAPLLHETPGRGFLVVARAWRQPPAKEAVVVVSDSASRVFWRADVGPRELDALLAAIRAMAARSRYVSPMPGDGDRTGVAERDSLVEPARVLRMGRPDYPAGLLARREPGRVWTQFIIGTDGRAELATLRILFATDPEFARAAAGALRGARFAPARTRAGPARQLVFLPFSFDAQ